MSPEDALAILECNAQDLIRVNKEQLDAVNAELLAKIKEPDRPNHRDDSTSTEIERLLITKINDIQTIVNKRKRVIERPTYQQQVSRFARGRSLLFCGLRPRRIRPRRLE